MSDLPLKATIKSGADFSAPWLTVDANDPDDLVFKLDALLNSDASAKVIELASQFKAANVLAPVLPSGATPTPAASTAPAAAMIVNGWGAPAQPQQTFVPQPQQQAPAWSGGPQPGVTTHPTDRCAVCQQVPLYKQVNRKSDGKRFEFWECPNQKSKGDGHYSEFFN